MSEDAALLRGVEILGAIDPEAYPGLTRAFAESAPGLADLIVATAFGKVASREGLDLKTRELATVCALAGMGGLQPQLTAHIVYALKLGWTAVELREALIQLAPVAGFPKVINGLAALADAVKHLEG